MSFTNSTHTLFVLKKSQQEFALPTHSGLNETNHQLVWIFSGGFSIECMNLRKFLLQEIFLFTKFSFFFHFWNSISDFYNKISFFFTKFGVFLKLNFKLTFSTTKYCLRQFVLFRKKLILKNLMFSFRF